MLQHGRKSLASFMLSGISDANWPPPAPHTLLNEAAKKEWREIVNNLTPDALPKESLPLLVCWCAIKVDLDCVLRAMARLHPDLAAEPDTVKQYRHLVKMRSQLGGQLASLSTKLRLTPASVSRMDAHRSPRISKKPWESANEQEDPTPQQSPDARRAPHGNGKPCSASESEQ